MNLTDAWNKGTLNKGWYFVKYDNKIYPDFYNKYFVKTGDKHGLEVLAPCNYDHLVELTKKVEAQNQELQQLKEENADLQEGSDSLRELNKLMRRNYDKKVDDLRSLLKECMPLLNSHPRKFKLKYLLTKINAAIGESEE